MNLEGFQIYYIYSKTSPGTIETSKILFKEPIPVFDVPIFNLGKPL